MDRDVEPALREVARPMRPAAPTPRAPEAASGLLDLGDLWRIARRHLRLAILVAAATFVLALVVILLLPLRYTGTAVLLLDPRSSKVVPSEEVVPGFGEDAAAIESQAQLITSDGFIRKAIDNDNLAGDPEIADGPSFFQRLFGRAPSPKPAAGSAPQISSEVVQRFKDKLTVARKGLTYVVEITFRAATPEAAARFANAVANVYLQDLFETRLRTTEQASNFLADRLDALRQKAEKSDNAVAAFRAAHHMIESGGNTTLIERQLADLNLQLAAAQARLADAGARLKDIEAARAAPSGSFPEALTSPLITNLRTQYSTLSQRVIESEKSLGERHPALVALRSQQEDLRREIIAEVARIEAGVRREYAAAQSREAYLQGELDKLAKQSGTNDEDAVALHELERQSETDRAIYNQFLTRYKDTSQQEGLRIGEARLVSAATPPDRSNLPRTWILVAVAGMLGLLAGAGTVLVAENLDAGIRSASAIERATGVPCLGVLPAVAGAAGEERLQGAMLRPILRLFRGGAGAAAMPVLLVTSASAGEGKSVVARAIARAAAASGLETLLIETAPAPERVSSPGRAAPAGLYEVLCQEVELNAALRPRAAGYLVLPAGEPGPASMADALLADEVMDRLLRRCRRTFKAIVIDGPLSGPTYVGGDLAPFADGVAIVVEWGRTQVPALTAAVGALAHARAVVALLSKVDFARYRLYEASAT